LDGSQAIAIDNQIKGGGVAGVLLQGNLIAARNRLEGQNGGSGISIGKGSHATLKNNDISGYRNAINDQRE
jgi:nitrous oxidase accessory protein NosD